MCNSNLFLLHPTAHKFIHVHVLSMLKNTCYFSNVDCFFLWEQINVQVGLHNNIILYFVPRSKMWVGHTVGQQLKGSIKDMLYTHIIFLCLRSELFFKHINQGTTYPASFTVCGESKIIGMNMAQTLNKTANKM